MNAPLYNELMAYSHSKLAFHMPGHKFGSIANLNKLNLSCLDNTEAMGMDNLYEAQGIIKDAMLLMADFYGAKDSLFLTNGSTAGILASILAVCKPGDQLIVARNAHHSVWNGLILAGADPVYISPEFSEEEDLLGEMKPQQVEMAIKAYPEAKGVLVVSPTYEGVVSNIKAIAEVVHKHNMVLIVDEAHGAHFVLGNDYPLSSIRQGADIVINSMHKTLPALTQSGLIHICSDKVKYEDVVSSLRMIQTSSPSYMMMGLMDYIRCYILEYHNLIKKQYTDVLLSVRDTLKRNLNALRLIEREHRSYDISKIVISTKYAGISGYELEAVLNRDFNIVAEAALDTYVILMTTMADQKYTLSRLQEALLRIDRCLQPVMPRQSINSFMDHTISLGKNPRDIYYGKKEWIKLEESEGKIVARNVMLYPPGIPIVCIGEEIKRHHIRRLSQFKDKLQGTKIIDNQVMVQIYIED